MAELLNRNARESLPEALARLGLHIDDRNGAEGGEAPRSPGEPFASVDSEGREPPVADELPAGDLDDFRKE